MRSWLFLTVGWAALAVYGCSTGTSSTASNGGSTTGSGTTTGTTGTTTSTGGATTVGTTSTGGAPTTGTTTGMGGLTETSSTGGSTTTTPLPCPLISGVFKMSAQGAGCGDLDVNAVECIKETMSFCTILFVSSPTSTTPGVNGLAVVDMNGDFATASLKEGTVMRTGCTGTYTAGNPSTMVVDCGGMGSSQSCVVTLTHAGNICPF